MPALHISILLQIALLIIGIYLAFFKSYIQNKGENFASKEEIEKLQSKMEVIKSEFILETNKLKIELNNYIQSDKKFLLVENETLKNELKELKAEFDRINDRSGFEEFMSGLFGSDGGMGEASDTMSTALVAKVMFDAYLRNDIEMLKLLIDWMKFLKSKNDP